MIVDCALYRHGRRVAAHADVQALLTRARAEEDAFCWIGLFEPSRGEFDAVTHGLGLHPLAAEDAVTAHQRPKLEVYDAALFLVLKPVLYDDRTDTITVSEINVFVGDSFVVTVRHGEANPLGGVRARLEQQPDVLAHGPTAVVYAVCDAVVDNYLDVADDFHTDLEELEADVFQPGGADTRRSAARIYDFKRQALEFRRVTGPLTDPIARLSGTGLPFVGEGARPFFRDVGDHLARVNEHGETIDRLLSDILSAHLARVGVQQNDDMRKISAYAAMAAAPTVIGSIYGMNFDHMPELHWTLGYPAVLLLMASVVLWLYMFFRRRGWLGSDGR
ncbi:magnesium/cobalt transporter CorA [Streptomyces sp. WMMC500]|uniref:magnesium/cobalt transporter CorA n=1 Tax=Streptomyces sp. WMMC500 TaxID=3015154 RepID=UPI00248AB354|nr:magnesium/cobalt transporter CorA [Streptomyces sp. WMMC500]WBB60309.1 magnesium/cobalt transporter CorA [Streptomyces sp. WMMC500]